MPNNYFVLIGSVKNISGPSTHGSGFLIVEKENYYVVTCRHVIREASGEELFALPNPRKTKNPPGGYLVLSLGRPTYHPKDDHTGTYDIAVTPVLNVTPEMLSVHSIEPLNLSNNRILKEFKEGEEFVAQGFPIDYVSAELIKNKNEPLLPRQIQGSLCKVPLGSIPQQGFDAPLKEALFVQTDGANHSGKGMSGGLVRSSRSKNVAGIVLGSVELQITCRDATAEIKGFIFVGASRIIETIIA